MHRCNWQSRLLCKKTASFSFSFALLLFLVVTCVLSAEEHDGNELRNSEKRHSLDSKRLKKRTDRHNGTTALGEALTPLEERNIKSRVGQSIGKVRK